MKKKFICTVCGYIYEGTEAPEKCPICKAPASKFKEMEDAVDDDMTFATVHVLGQAYKDSVNEDVIKGLKDHFNGECGEVGMYLAMARQADREGYPEIAEAYKRYAYEEADHASRSTRDTSSKKTEMRPFSSRHHKRESFLCKGFSFFVLSTYNFTCNKVPAYFCSSTLLCKESGLMLR